MAPVVSKPLYCKAGDHLLLRPVQLDGCGHSVCEACRSTLKAQDPNRSYKCPACRVRQYSDADTTCVELQELSEAARYLAEHRCPPLPTGMPDAEQLAVARRSVEICQILIHSQRISMQSLESENRRLSDERTKYRDELRHAKYDLAENQRMLTLNADTINSALTRFENLDEDYQRQRQHRESCDRLHDSYQHLLSEYSEKTAELRVEIAALNKQLHDALSPLSPVHSLADDTAHYSDDDVVAYSPSRPPYSPSREVVVLDSREASPTVPSENGDGGFVDSAPLPKKARMLAYEPAFPVNEESNVRQEDAPLEATTDDHAGPSVPKDERPIWQVVYDTVGSFEKWLHERRSLYEMHNGAEKMTALVEEFLRVNGLSANTPDNSLIHFVCHEKALEVFTAFLEK